MKWPWQARRDATAQRQEAEARADQVHWEVVRPLREMRARNHMTDAVVADIRKRLRESGS